MSEIGNNILNIWFYENWMGVSSKSGGVGSKIEKN